ncbi:hypothetical protein I4U23_003839 [Adineta vaga]|nr:hypothetical protein I4U23_003839 [Adineta vaga]
MSKSRMTICTPMIFLGSSFKSMDRINTDEISSLIRTGQLEIKNTFIQIYESEEIRNAFSYRQHGFEYWQLEGSILDAVFQMARRSNERENRIFLRQAIVPLVIEWGRRQNFQFNVMVPVDTVYRDSNHKQNNNAFGPVCFAHIDFSTIDLIETFLHFKNTWKINIELALGRQPHTLTDEQYASIHVEKMINLWIPLSSCSTKNTLAVMDCSSFGQFNQEIQPYTAIRKSGDYFTALGLYSSRTIDGSVNPI